MEKKYSCQNSGCALCPKSKWIISLVKKKVIYEDHSYSPISIEMDPYKIRIFTQILDLPTVKNEEDMFFFCFLCSAQFMAVS